MGLKHGGRTYNSRYNDKGSYPLRVGKEWNENYAENSFHLIMIKFYFNLLQNCAQGDRTVEVYTVEFHRLLSRNNLHETESQQVTRYISGLRLEIQDRISLVPVYTLDDAYNLAIRAESQLAKSTRGNSISTRYKNVSSFGQASQRAESSYHVAKGSALDKRKQTASTSVPVNKQSNPYAQPVSGKCFKCGVLGHRSSDCRAAEGKVNLTSRENESDEEAPSERSIDEEIETEVCYPPQDDIEKEYAAKSFVVRRIMLAPKVSEPSQQHNLFQTRCVIHQKIFDVIIDSGSTENIVSRDIIQRLKLTTEKHLNPYKIGWIKSVGDIKVTERCKIPFAIGKYKDEIMCDIVDIDACHLLLGRP